MKKVKAADIEKLSFIEPSVFMCLEAHRTEQGISFQEALMAMVSYLVEDKQALRQLVDDQAQAAAQMRNAWRLRGDIIRRLQDRLFELGEMNNPPCFLCGYSGPDYYDPEVHACASRHFATRRKGDQ